MTALLDATPFVPPFPPETAATRLARAKLLARIHRRYRTVTEPRVVGPMSLPFTRIANPDDRRGLLVVLDVVAASEPMKSYQKIEQSYRDATAGFSTEELAMIAKFLEGMGRLAEEMSGDTPAPARD